MMIIFLTKYILHQTKYEGNRILFTIESIELFDRNYIFVTQNKQLGIKNFEILILFKTFCSNTFVIIF